MHIGSGIYMDQETDAGDDEQEQRRQRVDQERKGYAEFACVNKLKECNGDGLKTLLFNLEKNDCAYNE